MGLRRGPAAAAGLLVLGLLGLVRGQDDDAPPARPELVAPARVPLHRGPRVGDTLERTVKQRDVEMLERTAIVGSGPDGTWIVERSGGAWPGVVLRMIVDTTGRVLRAEAGPAGAKRRSAITVGEESPPDDERLAGAEDVRCPAGTFRCEKRVLERTEPFPVSNVRWLVESGARAGLLVRQESRAGGRVTRLELVAVDDVTLKVGDGKDGLDVPCVHATLQPSLDGVPSPSYEQWTAIRPLLFGETLVRMDNGLGRTEITRLAHDGVSAFPR